LICQECQKRPATLHFTKIVNGEKNEYHLCEECAQEKGDFFKFYHSPGISINNLLAGLLNFNPSVFQNNHGEGIKPDELLQCEKCGLTFSQFLKVGKFGCDHCYTTFDTQLTPVLRRLHGGNWKHSGKIPHRSGESLQLRKKIDILKETLQTLVKREEFEKAAEVRDEIRMYEKMLQGGE